MKSFATSRGELYRSPVKHALWRMSSSLTSHSRQKGGRLHPIALLARLPPLLESILSLDFFWNLLDFGRRGAAAVGQKARSLEATSNSVCFYISGPPGLPDGFAHCNAHTTAFRQEHIALHCVSTDGSAAALFINSEGVATRHSTHLVLNRSVL